MTVASVSSAARWNVLEIVDGIGGFKTVLSRRRRSSSPLVCPLHSQRGRSPTRRWIILGSRDHPRRIRAIKHWDAVGAWVPRFLGPLRRHHHGSRYRGPDPRIIVLVNNDRSSTGTIHAFFVELWMASHGGVRRRRGHISGNRGQRLRRGRLWSPTTSAISHFIQHPFGVYDAPAFGRGTLTR